MKSNDVWVWCLFCMLCFSYGSFEAQELKPPIWSVGDWWIMKSQVYDLAKIVPEAKPRWLPTQAWRFHVEQQELIEDQLYFVVSVHPIEENACPYWFRYWFRAPDRYVGRYELHHPQTSSRTQRFSDAVVRKNFDPTKFTPFLTTTFPTLPVAVPVFTEASEPASPASQEPSIRSEPATYASPEFEIAQEVQPVDASTVYKKANPDLLGRIGNISGEGHTLITLRTTASFVEEQIWDPQLPWCVYGERMENSIVSKRYWLVEVGKD